MSEIVGAGLPRPYLRMIRLSGLRLGYFIFWKSLNFQVSDGELAASSQASIVVALAPQNPTVNLDLTPSFPTTPGQQVIVQTQATGLADITGNTVQHTFTSSGEYQTTLTVVDAYGLKDTKTVTVYVGSTAPTSGDDPIPPGFGDVAPQITDLPVPKKVYSLDPTNFSATATSPLGEPLTYTWNFGDGTEAVVGQSVSHTFVASGQYDATLTVTDDFGFSDTKTVSVYVGSTAPTENDDSSLPDWNGTWDDIFSQFGNMN